MPDRVAAQQAPDLDDHPLDVGVILLAGVGRDDRLERVEADLYGPEFELVLEEQFVQGSPELPLVRGKRCADPTRVLLLTSTAELGWAVRAPSEEP